MVTEVIFAPFQCIFMRYVDPYCSSHNCSIWLFIFYFFFFFFFRENNSWHFMWIVCLADNSHEISRLVFSEKWTKHFECLLQILLGALRVNNNEAVLMCTVRYVLVQKISMLSFGPMKSLMSDPDNTDCTSTRTIFWSGESGPVHLSIWHMYTSKLDKIMFWTFLLGIQPSIMHHATALKSWLLGVWACTTCFILITNDTVLVVQSQNFMTPSHPAVATFDVSWGCHRADMHTSSWALNLEYNFVDFQSQIYNFPSASPDTM